MIIDINTLKVINNNILIEVDTDQLHDSVTKVGSIHVVSQHYSTVKHIEATVVQVSESSKFYTQISKGDQVLIPRFVIRDASTLVSTVDSKNYYIIKDVDIDTILVNEDILLNQ